ncbi:MAG: response regulator [Candidatus Omnitrophica bacterium]|nr:response regulator [Candidatus Omnitrophota bacterium]
MTKKILLIDDDPLVLKTLKKLLKAEGYCVELAKAAQEGLEKGKTLNVDLIICDVKMPEINGIELIKQVKEFRKNENKPDVPVIFITGYASEDAPIEAIKLGARDYLLKPFDLDKLLGSVKANLAKSD